MKFIFSATLLSLAAFASAASIVGSRAVQCSEANRVGTITVTPTTIHPGGTVSIHADYTCAFEKGYPPAFQAYTLAVPVNNTGFEPDTLLAFRNTSSLTAASPIDDFTATVPFGFFNPASQYVVRVSLTYGHSGSNGSPIYQFAELRQPITFTGI